MHLALALAPALDLGLAAMQQNETFFQQFQFYIFNILICQKPFQILVKADL